MKQSVRRLSRDAVAIAESSLPSPVVTYLVQERTWRLEVPYSYRDEAHHIHVPDRFEFDLASIPRPFWWLVAPFELSIAAPLLHDFLYRYQGDPPAGSIDPPLSYSRAEADRLFRDFMESDGVWAWRRVAAYGAVRWFGSGAWSAGS